jgi:molybdopterin synthase catalytic subunit
MIQVSVQQDPIDPASVIEQVGHEQDGAVLLFVGVVRNHADGRSVTGMRYESFEEMAVDVLEAIAGEAALHLGTDRIAVVHRIGELRIGDASVAIAVSSPHRGEAFEAARYVIEEVKKRLPVWKKEHYEDGSDEWVAGAVPPADGLLGGDG